MPDKTPSGNKLVLDLVNLLKEAPIDTVAANLFFETQDGSIAAFTILKNHEKIRVEMESVDDVPTVGTA